MEDILNQVEKLDNVQLRAELLKHGEKVGPVTPTTRTLFLSKLASKRYAAEHPEDSTVNIAATASQLGTERGAEANTVTGISSGLEPGVPATVTLTGAQISTPTGRKVTSGNSGDKEEPCAYYVVIQADSPTASSNASTISDHRVFTEKQEALAYMKKKTGSRLKVFHSSTDVKRFRAQSSKQAGGQDRGTEPKTEELSSNNAALEAEKSTFKGPKTQELVLFRKLIEKGDMDTVKSTVWSNPRYLITSADTPVILHEGMRHNALHIAAKTNQAAIVALVLDTLLNVEFTKLLYSSSHDTEQSRHHRIAYLVDLYLNSPDKGSSESPLHIACKMGHTAVVRCLVMFSVTDRTRINKYGEKPEDIICSRYKGDSSAAVKEEIQELLKGLCLVPLLRSRDNITVPVVGEPCSPEDKMKLRAPSSTPSLGDSPKEPLRTLSAYAGPMSPSKAREFQKQWMNPRYFKNSADAREITNARRADAEKGYERIGRKLARQLHVPWAEYWQFLDAFADFSTQEGLRKLEEHLNKQQALLTIIAAMERGSSDDDSASGSSSGETEDDSELERYFSCEEGSVKEAESDSSAVGDKRQTAELVELFGEEDEDVFEDSLENFFDTRGYIFGQRLQLKRNNNNNESQEKGRAPKVSESAVDASKAQEKTSSGDSSLWSYRDTLDSEKEEHRSSETSATHDMTHSFDDAGLSPDAGSGESDVDQCTNHCGGEGSKPPAAKDSAENRDKSFNTVMTELSEDLEVKLIFSPDGKVVPSQRGRQVMPDVGICLGRKFFATGIPKLRRGECPLDVVIKARKGANTFLADILVHSSCTNADSGDDSADDSGDDFPLPSRQTVVRDVKVVAKNEAVFQYVWHILRPVFITVAVLEPEVPDITQHCGCVNARIVRRKRLKSQQTACYIYGSSPCKADLDVMRAMSECDVDRSTFPAVHSWLSLIAATKQEGRDGWPSPAKLRHQHRLSQLQNQSLPGSPLPISPLVQGGTVTSTPVSRSSLASVHCNRDLSPERPSLMMMPRAWLFKSPT